MTHAEFDERNFVIRWKLDGEVTDELFAEYVRLSAATIPTLPAKALILDLTGASSFKVSAAALRELASKVPTLPGRFPRVIVARSDLTYGLSRMFAILSEEKRPNLHVVRTMEEAYALLKMRSPEFRPISRSRAVADS